jgi:hypothetical protein
MTRRKGQPIKNLKLSQALLGHKATFTRKHTDEERQKISSSNKGKKHDWNWTTGKSKETDNRIRLSAERSSVSRRKISKKRLSEIGRLGRSLTPSLRRSKDEIHLYNLLKEGGFPVKAQVRINRGSFTDVDIFYEPNICIYWDGIYYHSLPDVLKTDEKINKMLIDNDFRVLRITGNRKNNFDLVFEKIQEFVNSQKRFEMI